MEHGCEWVVLRRQTELRTVHASLLFHGFELAKGNLNLGLPFSIEIVFPFSVLLNEMNTLFRSGGAKYS